MEKPELLILVCFHLGSRRVGVFSTVIINLDIQIPCKLHFDALVFPGIEPYIRINWNIQS